ncbi:FadR/GntR family transcriptional regulator [Rhizobium paknamense]|uniref:GntR family transcriptional repressor for pyruvate dehydrogenase complex n=1 Tax=Rhizobium paknamense TaxID=1206817 RepID=A0ABU0IBX3_9HYPH|nr:FadR/GntR family transcriptional regulator [Rhizobium paknamense]MDQ0455734.1 GntR family transcriptional repressor for pyruvate dehydrogenase complex [Rhizobium paknamense]
MTLPRRLYQQIADQVRQLIQNGQYPPGSRLPAERDLAQMLGVSRPSLREALIALEIEGSIEIRIGSGIYVLAAGRPTIEARSPEGFQEKWEPVFRPEARNNEKSFQEKWEPVFRQETRNSKELERVRASMKHEPSLGESPTELMQARAVIESAVILRATAAMTDTVLEALRDILQTIRVEIGAGRKPIEQDRQFHLTIAEQAGNAVLAEIVANLFDERHSPMSDRIRGRFETPETWSMALAEHEAILAALEVRDPLAAQAAIHAHLTASGRRWLES